MRVLFATDEYPPFIRGGAGVYAYNITSRLCGKVEYDVVVPDKKKEHIRSEVPIDERVSVDRVGFIDLPGLRFPSSGYSIYRKYGKLADEYDIVHSSSGMGFMLSGRKLETVHHTMKAEMDFVSLNGGNSSTGMMNNLFYYKLRDRLERMSFKSSRHFIAMSEYTRRSLVEDYGIAESSITVTNSGVDTERFKPRDRHDSRDRLGLSHDDKILLFVGRLEERKNLAALIKSMALLGGYKLLICGGGPLENSMKSLAGRMGVKNVFFKGFVSEDMLPYYYNAADLLVHTAEVEGFCLSLVEALSSGIPVLAQRKSGMRDILDKCGVVEELPDTSMDSILAGVRGIVEGGIASERLPSYVSRARSEFNWDAIAGRTLEVYKKLASDKI
ncbi:MAG: glycosyltransferase family 4 protein [Candidatus Altiarchaeota archaeon]